LLGRYVSATQKHQSKREFTMKYDLPYEEWKKEKDVNLVCEKLLDNANMDIEIVSYPFAINLVFFVIGSDIKVTFYCKEIKQFCLSKSVEDEAMFAVFEVHVKNNTDITKIKVLPEAELEIQCAKFNWKLEQMTESERNM
jgi:hypothetical protein